MTRGGNRKLSRAPGVLTRSLRIPTAERKRLLEAAALLAYLNLAVKLLPFRNVIKFGSVPLQASNGDAEIDAIVGAVRRMSRRVPWRTVCIHEGLTTQRLLRRRGVPAVLCYGTRVDGDNLSSHVWVRVDDKIVIGGEDAPAFTLLATYPTSS